MNTDILADYREWRAQQPDRIGAHSDRCHLWQRHERCMIHRLAAELEEAIRRLAAQDATLTKEELKAVRTAAFAYAQNDDDDECAAIAAALLGLAERAKNG